METPNIPDSVEALFARDDEHKAANPPAPQPPAVTRGHLAAKEKLIRKRSTRLGKDVIRAGRDAYMSWIAQDNAARPNAIAGAPTTDATYGLALLQAHTMATAHALSLIVAGMASSHEHDGDAGQPITQEERQAFASELMMKITLTLVRSVELAMAHANGERDDDEDDDD